MTRRKARQARRPVPNPKPRYAAGFWELYREAQKRRRSARLPGRLNEVLSLADLGYRVVQISRPDDKNLEACFHVYGVDDRGITLHVCHRSYQVHDNLRKGTYDKQPARTLKRLGIFPKERNKDVEKHLNEVENGGRNAQAVEIRGFKPARNYWSWRKRFGGNHPAVSDSTAHPGSCAADSIASEPAGRIPERQEEPRGREDRPEAARVGTAPAPVSVESPSV